jgi:hypothetical protein
MKTRLHQIAIFGIAFLGSAAIANAQIHEIHSVPYTISSPGIYFLLHDIISHANAKITITASNVVLDLGGHTIEVSTTDEIISVGSVFSSAIPNNIVIKDGALINDLAGCILLVDSKQCVLDHVSATAADQCVLLDESGVNNRISHCTFVSGIPTSLLGPVGCRGPGLATVELLGCSDLLEDNIITSAKVSAISTVVTGCAAGSGGNVLRNNIIRAAASSVQGLAVLLDQFDVYIGLFFPGRPAGSINVTGGIHATE